MVSLNKSIYSLRFLCTTLKSSRTFSIHQSNKSKTTDKFEESDWFKKLTEPVNPASFKNQFKIENKFSSKKGFLDLSPEAKRDVILNLYNHRKENGLSVPKQLTDEYITQLLKCESFTHLTNSMVHIVKEEYYAYQKEQKRLEKQKRELKKLDENTVDVITNYPGKDSFLKRINTSDVRKFHRSKVLSSIITNEPSIVFDFRFTNMHTRIELVKSLYRQYIEIISSNRNSPNPFQIHFCNYDYSTEFHTKYSPFLEYDANLIFETPKNYTEIFPKDKLVYLSRDAKVKMVKYDPEKVYIVGSMIDFGNDKFKYCSYSQAKKEGIRCERLPLDDYVKWSTGQKSLNMDHVFSILLNLKAGMNWRDAFMNSLPSRKIENKF